MANKKTNKKKPVKKTTKVTPKKEKIIEEIEEEREEVELDEDDSANNKLIMGLTVGILATFVLAIIVIACIKGKSTLNYKTSEKFGKTI